MAKLLRQHLPRLLEAEGGDSKPDLDVYFHVNVMNFIELIRCAAQPALVHAWVTAMGELHHIIGDAQMVPWITGQVVVLCCNLSMYQQYMLYKRHASGMAWLGSCRCRGAAHVQQPGTLSQAG